MNDIHSGAAAGEKAAAAEVQRRLYRAGAWLFLIGLVTGLWTAIVLTEGRAIGLSLPKMEHPRLALGAHLAALLGSFWLVAVAATLPATRFAARGRLWITRLVVLPTYANWAVTLLASFVDATGLALTGEPKNDLIAVLLNVLVVGPSFAGAGLWVWGLGGK